MTNVKIARFWSVAPSGAARRPALSNSTAPDDSLDAFDTEAQGKEGPTADAHAGQAQRPRLWATAVAVLIAIGAAAYWRVDRLAFKPGSAPAHLTIETVPASAQVRVAGVVRGKTPLTMPMTAGEHTIEVSHGELRKTVQVPLAAGDRVVHHITFEAASAPTSLGGTLSIATEPSRLRVTVDGVFRGFSPLTLTGLTPGSHPVQVAHPAGVIAKSFEVKAGETVSVVLSGTTPPPVITEGAAGWLAVTASEPLQLLEKGQLIGTTQTQRVMLPTGRHDIELVSEALGYRHRRTVQIAPGATATLRIELPKAPLSLNAQPWAEVFIDGVRLGETPIGNHHVTIGSHEVVFRHPQLGERRQAVIVTVKGPTRASVDMRKP